MDVATFNSNTYDKIVLFPEAWSSKRSFSFYIDDVTLQKSALITKTAINRDANSSIYYSAIQHRLFIKCEGEGLVELVSLSGNIVKNFRINGDDIIELSGVQPGIYIVRLQCSGTRVVQKIIL
ncbi:MAG: T9SS type A sorting domain-containing protein [Bacteroidia bacterium]|nr:T9SS type A sorting domain-containing protein [Bacteroidia bacterium]